MRRAHKELGEETGRGTGEGELGEEMATRRRGEESARGIGKGMRGKGCLHGIP